MPVPPIRKVGLGFDSHAVARLGAFCFGAGLLYLHRRAIPLSVPAAAALLLAALLAFPGWPSRPPPVTLLPAVLRRDTLLTLP